MRRSVTKDSEQGFLGWNWIEKQLNKYYGQKRLRNRALFLTTFKTGGRITEVINLKRSMFTHDQNFIIIKEMMKRKDSDRNTYMPIKIPKKEPLNEEWIWYINQSKGYLFPSVSSRSIHYANGRGYSSYNKPLSRIRAYQIITKTGTYPHFLRSQRSSMEIEYYGIEPNRLVDLRQWKTDKMVRVYASASSQKQAQEKMLEKFNK